MNLSTGRTRLVVSISDGSGFTSALYLRDRFAPSALADIPPLDPPVPAPHIEGAGAPAHWDQWWETISSAQSGAVVAPPSGSPLAELFERYGDDMFRWIGSHEADDAIGSYRPEWLPPLLGSGFASGMHSTEVIPVRGTWWRPLSPRRLVVSTAAFADSELMDRLLREQVSALLSAE